MLPTAWALCHGQGTPGVESHGTGICFNRMCGHCPALKIGCKGCLLLPQTFTANTLQGS